MSTEPLVQPQGLLLSCCLVFVQFPQQQFRTLVVPAAFQNPCYFTMILMLCSTSMCTPKCTTVPPQILAIRQEALSLLRKQISLPEASGTLEYICAIHFFAISSLVSLYFSFGQEWRIILPPIQTDPTQAYRLEPDKNFETHWRAMSALFETRPASEYRKTDSGRCLIRTLIM